MQNAQRIDVHGQSIRGKTHDKNHDHFAIATLNKSMRLHQSNLTIEDKSLVHGHNQGHLFLVADGISGCPFPARASGTAVDSVVQYFLNEMPWYHLADGDPADVTIALEDALRNAQDDLLLRAQPDRPGLGTTMTLAFVFWPNLYIAHVGNSRCYLKTGGKLRQLTTDHTLAEVRRSVGGQVTPGSQRKLWNAIGGQGPELQPEVRHLELESGDVLALVTDGAAGVRTECELLTQSDQQESAESICDRILGRSGEDDSTAIVIRFLPFEPIRIQANSAPTPTPIEARKELPTRRPSPKRVGAVEPRKPPYRMSPSPWI